jgi:hypothetical protein
MNAVPLTRAFSTLEICSVSPSIATATATSTSVNWPRLPS